jgi:hypothetical protein
MLGLIWANVAMAPEWHSDEVTGRIRTARVQDDFARIQLNTGIRARREANN